MTEQTVQIIITLKVKENDLSFERPIDITNLEKDIGSFSQEIGSQILSMMLKLLDDMLRNIVPNDWKTSAQRKEASCLNAVIFTSNAGSIRTQKESDTSHWMNCWSWNPGNAAAEPLKR